MRLRSLAAVRHLAPACGTTQGNLWAEDPSELFAPFLFRDRQTAHLSHSLDPSAGKCGCSEAVAHVGIGTSSLTNFLAMTSSFCSRNESLTTVSSVNLSRSTGSTLEVLLATPTVKFVHPADQRWPSDSRDSSTSVRSVQSADWR